MRIISLTILIALLAACGGERGKMVLKGELYGLRQGELLIWNDDGLGNRKIDTIQIERGTFEYKSPAEDRTTAWTLVYPNMSTLNIFGRSGDVITLKGKANELKRVEVSGSQDNDLYTAFRLGTLTADSLIRTFPATAVAMHVFKTQYLNDKRAKRSDRARLFKVLQEANPEDSLLLSWKPWAKAKAPLRVGQRLPRFSVVTCGGDTISDSTFHGHPLLVGVWMAGDVGSRAMLRAFRNQRRQMEPKGKKGRTKDKKKRWNLQLLTINVDLSPTSRATFERLDSIDWHSLNTNNLFSHPLLQDWEIETSPYIIYVDTAGIVRALGTDFETDIKPKI